AASSRIQGARVRGALPVGGGLELVIGGTGTDAGAQLRDAALVQDRAERTRREHVALLDQDLVETDDAGAELVARGRGAPLVDVGHDDLRARFGEVAAQ